MSLSATICVISPFRAITYWLLAEALGFWNQEMIPQ